MKGNNQNKYLGIELSHSAPKRVRWVDVVQDNEGKTKRNKKNNKPLLNKYDADQTEKYIENKFKNKQYDELKAELLNNYSEKEIVKILSVKNCGPFIWACVNGEVKALRFFTELLSPYYLSKIMNYDECLPLRVFLNHHLSYEKVYHTYDKKDRIEGFKILYQIDPVNFANQINTYRNVTPNMRQDFQEMLVGLEAKALNKQEDKSRTADHNFAAKELVRTQEKGASNQIGKF